MLLNHKGYYNVSTNQVLSTGLLLIDGVGTLNDAYTIFINPNSDRTYLFDRNLGSGLTSWVANSLIIYDGTKWYSPATASSGGGSGVTSVAVDATLQASPNPITSTGTIGMPSVVTPGSFTNSNITIDAQGRVTVAANGSSGGSMAIGGAVSGGTPNYILYIDASSQLAQDINFQWLSAAKTLQFGTGCQIYYDTQFNFLDTGTGDSVFFLSPSVTYLGSTLYNAVLYIDKLSGITAIGDVFFNNNGTQVYIDDVAQSVLIRGNIQLTNYTINGGFLYTDGSGNVSQTRIGCRVVTVADATSITPNADTMDICSQVNTQPMGGLAINAPMGTYYDGQNLEIRIQSTNILNFAWNTIYRGCTTTSLPSVTSAGTKIDKMWFQYDDITSKFELFNVQLGY